MPDFPSIVPALISRLELRTDRNVDNEVVEFNVPGGATIINSPSVIDGSLISTVTYGGNYLLTFDAVQRNTANTFGHVDTEKQIKRLLYEAEKSKDINSTRVLLRINGYGDTDTQTMRVVGGSIKRTDSEVVKVWNTANAVTWSINIELLPWSELPEKTSERTNVSCYGGIVYSNVEQGGTADGRIRRISVYPNVNARFSKLWIGVKPDFAINNLSIYGQLITRLNVGAAQNRSIGTYNVNDSDAVGTDAKEIIYAATGKSLASWRPRFSLNYADWGDAPYNRAQYMPGKYRLLARPKFPGTRVGNPRWGIRARLMYGYGTEEWQEISRTPEFIFPDVSNSQYYSYYDLGQIDIGGSHYSQVLNDFTQMTIVMDTALLNIDSQYTYSTSNTTPWVSNWTRFDDYILLPAEPYIHVNLPRFIQENERLDIYIDDYGNVEVYAVERVIGGGRKKRLVFYKAQSVTTSEGGFYLPGKGGSHALVFVADTDPAHPFSTTATFDKIELVVSPRVHGGPL